MKQKCLVTQAEKYHIFAFFGGNSIIIPLSLHPMIQKRETLENMAVLNWKWINSSQRPKTNMPKMIEDHYPAKTLITYRQVSRNRGVRDSSYRGYPWPHPRVRRKYSNAAIWNDHKKKSSHLPSMDTQEQWNQAIQVNTSAQNGLNCQ